jgi:phage gp37-like protein
MYAYGCAAPLAMHGLSSGVPVAFSGTGKGEGDSAWFAHYDDVVQATILAGEKLSLKLEKKMVGSDQNDFHFIDEKGNKLEIYVERRTETLTYARYTVGMFGSTSVGRLMARQIVVEMAEAEKFLRDWHPAEED